MQEGTLCRTLQRLTERELIERERAAHFPFTTTYWLTPPARELLTVMVPAAEWARTHSELLVRAQQRRKASDR
ncbi:winged helix-turn-helix transcriptional regulator [Streptomyces longispororuber]|uniref:winged helix-turn-helix transcriptional regulator n=1 Tax=Streptomyces longispororuber TaxID=68230 RepID=UPI00357106A4